MTRDRFAMQSLGSLHKKIKEVRRATRNDHLMSLTFDGSRGYYLLAPVGLDVSF